MITITNSHLVNLNLVTEGSENRVLNNFFQTVDINNPDQIFYLHDNSYIHDIKIFEIVGSEIAFINVFQNHESPLYAYSIIKKVGDFQIDLDDKDTLFLGHFYSNNHINPNDIGYSLILKKL
jgi:hypothetical protein